MAGYAVCVYDLYEDFLSAYRASLASLRTQLESVGVVLSEWPSRIKSLPNSQVIRRPPNTSLDTFEAMGNALRKVGGALNVDVRWVASRNSFPMSYEGTK